MKTKTGSKKLLNTMSRLVLLFAIAATYVFTDTVLAAQTDVSVAAFDAAVKTARLEMRQSCALTQQLMKAPAADKKQQAIEHIQQAQQKWQAVQNQFADNPPQAYAGDKTFKMRLQDIGGGMAAMQAGIEADQYQKGFKSCAMTCGKFVDMHEQNGLVYALDRIFHVRKAIKAATMLNSAGKSLAHTVPELQRLRDRIFAAPAPANGEKYYASLKAASALIDQLAIDVYNDNKEAVSADLQKLMKAFADTYAQAL